MRCSDHGSVNSRIVNSGDDLIMLLVKLYKSIRGGGRMHARQAKEKEVKKEEEEEEEARHEKEKRAETAAVVVSSSPDSCSSS